MTYVSWLDSMAWFLFYTKNFLSVCFLLSVPRMKAFISSVPIHFTGPHIFLTNKLERKLVYVVKNRKKNLILDRSHLIIIRNEKGPVQSELSLFGRNVPLIQM